MLGRSNRYRLPV